MSALGFKARVDPLPMYFVAYVQWIPQIYLWCNTRCLLAARHFSQAIFAHIQALVGLESGIEHATASQGMTRQTLYRMSYAGSAGDNDNRLIKMCVYNSHM